MEDNILHLINSGEYFLSQSRLKRFLYGEPENFLLKSKESESKASRIGRYFEAKFYLAKFGINNLEQFYVSDTAIPDEYTRGKMVNYMTYLKKNYVSDDNLEELRKKAYESLGYKKDVFESTEELWKTKGEKYFREYLENRDKIQITSEEHELVEELIEKTLSYERIIDFFEGFEVFTGIKMFFNYLDEDCVAIPDIVMIDEDNRKIRIVEIKTTTRETTIAAAMADRWDIQMAFYKEAVTAKYPNFEIECYYIAVKIDTKTVVLRKFSDLDLLVGKHGVKMHSKELEIPNITKYKNIFSVKGFHQLVELYKWHRDNGVWEMSKEEYESEMLETQMYCTKDSYHII